MSLQTAILFDLDGTLLPMDTDAFVKTYMTELAKRVAHIVDSTEFTKALWAGTHAMMKNVDGEKRNDVVFQETFLKLLNIAKEDIWPTLDEFYEIVFPSFSYLTTPNPIAKEVVELALLQGYKVAIATNPLFPEVAIYERIRWAGLTDIPFSFVTVYENSYFTKPHPQYFQQICDALEVNATDSIMVGNDRQEDMAASLIGMKTYLVEDWAIDRGEPKFAIDAQGKLQDLYQDLKEQRGLFAKK
ncbi:haloacid dehalogenase [Desulfuribacillus stibiiarsenatis]|uniref:Haloacid dehalogenase n=1 Tax=Desulfuribacillus stibiiarsenatis TaxID=1390249 RepID=A0A1E5L966_9FIRM|nr:HAD family hydrolase [Desulfuribacillus stibiiarsenatis]OEH86666.1 haloacid dehalogenase [Desulfuribacillus stibiiarsenatis]